MKVVYVWHDRLGWSASRYNGTTLEKSVTGLAHRMDAVDAVFEDTKIIDGKPPVTSPIRVTKTTTGDHP